MRLKRAAAQEKSESHINGDPETSKLWLDAVADFETREVINLTESTQTLTRTQSRKLKKRAFLHIIRVYMQRHGKTRRGFNQFAKSALDRMSEYEVQDDLECYKAIIGLFPPDRMVVTSFLQAEFGHFYRQQNTMISILQQMTKHHVIADDEVGQLIINIFGWRNHAMQHYRHMMYWVPKLANANPWPVADRISDDLDEDPLRLARLIAERVCPDRMTDLHVVKLSKDAVGSNIPSSLISAQSPEQRALLSHAINFHSRGGSKVVLYLDGPHFVWYQRLQAAYYTLWTELDRQRLDKEIKQSEVRTEKRQKTDLTNLPLTSHTDTRIDQNLDRVEMEPHTSADLLRFPTPSRPSNLIDTIAHAYDMNTALLNRPSSQLQRVQPEYDDRWVALRQSHAYNFLPNHLTLHEQVEGQVLAVGVVTPTQDALDMQKRFFSKLVSDELDVSSNPSTKQTCDPTPRYAPPNLIRLWLKQLEFHNPSIVNATLVIRVPTVDGCNNEPESSDDAEFVRHDTSS